MYKHLSITFIWVLLMRFELYAQEILVFDSIDYEKEKTELNLFVKQFLSESDSVQIQKYIQFPILYVQTCGGMLRTPNPQSKMSEKEIIKASNGDHCHYPLYYWLLKYQHDNSFRRSLDKKNISLEEYYYSDNGNRNAMCNYLIKNYMFPINIGLNENDTIRYYDTYESSYKNSQPYKYLKVSAANWIIGVIKVNRNYKISSIGYIWD